MKLVKKYVVEIARFDKVSGKRQGTVTHVMDKKPTETAIKKLLESSNEENKVHSKLPTRIYESEFWAVEK